jgi:hypothetical protein
MHIPPTFQAAGPFGLGPGEIIVILLVWSSLMMFVPTIFYILTLKSAIEKCAPENQAMPTVQFWLLLVPLFTVVWHFIVVSRLTKSLGDEFRRRGIGNDPEPGGSLGITMCVLQACSLVPLLGILSSLAGFICWILYWVKISDCSRILSPNPVLYYGAPGQFPPVRR